MNKKPAKGIRKYIRLEKARIRREVFDQAERKRKFAELYDRLGLKKEEAKKDE